MSVVNDGFNGRKAIKDGLKMLEARYMQRDSQQKQTMLENRIKRLVYEEQRASSGPTVGQETNRYRKRESRKTAQGSRQAPEGDGGQVDARAGED